MSSAGLCSDINRMLGCDSVQAIQEDIAMTCLRIYIRRRLEDRMCARDIGASVHSDARRASFSRSCYSFCPRCLMLSPVPLDHPLNTFLTPAWFKSHTHSHSNFSVHESNVFIARKIDGYAHNCHLLCVNRGVQSNPTHSAVRFAPRQIWPSPDSHDYTQLHLA